MDEEMHELKEMAERTDREHEFDERRQHHYGESRSRIHSFYPNEDEMEQAKEYGQFEHHSDQ